MKRGFLIAAPQSGSGKTTVCLALMAAFTRRGLGVAPFKCGPDFIDPGYHRLASGNPSINLDPWICSSEFVAATFAAHSAESDLAVIEGVMGLFDGFGSSSMEGSSAQVAAVTGAPVVLVVNARGMAASAAALVRGFAGHEPRVRVAGVIFNQVGSQSHGELLHSAIRDALPGLKVFGWIPRDAALEIPSRHLGLVTVEDNQPGSDYLQQLADLAERYLDLDALAGLEFSSLEIPPSPPFVKGGMMSPPSIGNGGEGISVRIAVARDAAFCFMYEDNLRLLREAGAELVFFSPLADRCVPEGTHGIYLPGGYPELYAERLAANGALRSGILAAVEGGLPVYAECGGLIYLTEGMQETDGAAGADFVGVFPARARMLNRRKALGYRQVRFVRDTPLGRAGETARGHEFHYSEIASMPESIRRCYELSRQGDLLGEEGYLYRNCLASYVHLHFGSNPALAGSFHKACAAAAGVLQA